jgi:hypothetical protein
MPLVVLKDIKFQFYKTRSNVRLDKINPIYSDKCGLELRVMMISDCFRVNMRQKDIKFHF